MTEVADRGLLRLWRERRDLLEGERFLEGERPRDLALGAEGERLRTLLDCDLDLRLLRGDDVSGLGPLSDFLASLELRGASALGRLFKLGGGRWDLDLVDLCGAGRADLDL